jgi:dipeptidyl aminopeptidase/acylaminoacyl peptidase
MAKVWAMADGRELFSLKGHTDGVDSVSWSPDGMWLATGSFDGTAKVWKMPPSGGRQPPDGLQDQGADAPRSPALTLQGRRVCWSPDGTWLATVCQDGTAKVWDAQDGRPLLKLNRHRSAVTAASWSPDSKRLATASADGTAIVWDVARKRVLATLQGHTSAISVVAWSPDGYRLASSSAGYGSEAHTDVGEVKIWDAAGGRQLLTLKGHTGKVHSVSWSPDGKRLATGSEGGTVKLWDASSGRELLAYTGQIHSVSWSPDGKQLAMGTRSGTVKVCEAASKEAVQEWARQDRALEDSLARNALRGRHALGFIQTWLLLLPLPLAKGETVAQALDRKQLAGEAQLRPRIGEQVSVGDRELVWREHRSPEAIVDFNAVLGRQSVDSIVYAVYAVCYVESDRARDDLRLEVAGDDQAKVYLNGTQIYQSRHNRPVIGLDTVRAPLEPGTNVLVFKVVNGSADWEGCVRLVDAVGRPADGIRVKLTPE